MVPLLYEKFIRVSKEMAHALLKVASPPNSANLVLSRFNKIPRAAALTIAVLTVPPTSLLNILLNH